MMLPCPAFLFATRALDERLHVDDENGVGRIGEEAKQIAVIRRLAGRREREHRQRADCLERPHGCNAQNQPPRHNQQQRDH